MTIPNRQIWEMKLPIEKLILQEMKTFYFLKFPAVLKLFFVQNSNYWNVFNALLLDTTPVSQKDHRGNIQT